MSSPRLEEFLARLHSVEAALEAFLRAPAETAGTAGLDNTEVSALVGADHVGLAMAAASFRAKRERRKHRHPVLRRLSRQFSAVRPPKVRV
jgi:hypothetical protein